MVRPNWDQPDDVRLYRVHTPERPQTPVYHPRLVDAAAHALYLSHHGPGLIWEVEEVRIIRGSAPVVSSALLNGTGLKQQGRRGVMWYCSGQRLKTAEGQAWYRSRH